MCAKCESCLYLVVGKEEKISDDIYQVPVNLGGREFVAKVRALASMFEWVSGPCASSTKDRICHEMTMRFWG